MSNNIKVWIVGIVLTIPLLAVPPAQAGYDECVNACVADGYNENYCRNACS